MPDLRSDLEALRDNLMLNATNDDPMMAQQYRDDGLDPKSVAHGFRRSAEKLALLLTGHTEAGEWRGPVRCNKCSKVYATAPSAHYWSWNEHPYPRELCDGTFVPYERRKAGA